MSFPHAGYRPPTPLFGDPAGDTAAGTYGANEPITVYVQGTSTKVTIWTDTNRSATAANPVVTDGVGNLSYFTDPQLVDEVTPDGARTPNLVSPNPVDLAASAGLGIVPMAPWQPATVYTAGQVVTFAGQTWGCVTPHTSGATFNAGEQANWTLMAAGGVGSSPSASVVGPDSFGASSTAGSSTSFSRGDHDHGLPANPSPAASGTAVGPDAWGASAAAGASTSYSRGDHHHGLPADPEGLPVGGTGLTGATASARFVGGTSAGAPVSGTFGLGDFTVDQTGTFWICTVAGTPGTWVAVPADSAIVHVTGAETIGGNKTFSGAVTFSSTLAGTSASWSSTDAAQAFVPSGLSGATASSRWAGATASGAPASGTFATGDWIVDQSGAFWVCTAGGTPGTWVKTGAAVSISPATTVTGPAAYGAATVVGTSANYAREDHGHGNLANPTGQPLALSGATTATRYVGGTTSGAPVSGTFALGDFIIDRSGAVWICTAGGTPGTWKPIPGPGSVLARTVYGPASIAIYNITAQTLGAVDTTNLTVGPFTVPPSGNVNFVVHANGHVINGSNVFNCLTLGAMNHSGGAQLGGIRRGLAVQSFSSVTTSEADMNVLIPITGLTAGTSLQIDLGALQQTAGQTANIFVQDGTVAHGVGPAILEVIAA